MIHFNDWFFYQDDTFNVRSNVHFKLVLRCYTVHLFSLIENLPVNMPKACHFLNGKTASHAHERGSHRTPNYFSRLTKNCLRQNKTLLGGHLKDLLSASVAEGILKTGPSLLYFYAFKAKPIFWKRHNREAAQANMHSRPSDDVSMPCNREAMSQSPHIKVKVMTKGHRAKVEGNRTGSDHNFQRQ